jgi:hypothetical protein
MRSRLFVILTALGSASCASPLAALPLVSSAMQPQVLSAPMEDGSLYVLAEGSRLTSNVTLRSMWRREASKACLGEYMVLSERDAQSRRGGIVGGRSYEGFVRCISPESTDLAPARVSKR